MELTTTFKLLRDANACAEGYKHLRTSLRAEDYDDNTPINLLTILEHNGLDDALWALQATAQNCDKVARLVAADFAEQAIPTWQVYAPTDNRPQRAIQAARDYAHGSITASELDAARDAAADAAEAAEAAPRTAAGVAAWVAAEAAARTAAGDAARAAGAAARAAGAAAWEAARAKQKEIFISYLQPEECEDST